MILPFPPPADLLPHRGIALVLDEITALVPGERAVGLWSPRDQYFAGHFPGDQVLPGHWSTEAINLVAACAILAQYPDRLLLYREGYQKFIGGVRPGDTLELVADVTSLREERGRLIASADGSASVAGKIVVKATGIKIVA